MGRDISAAIIFVTESRDILLQKKTLDYKGPSPGGWFFFGGAIEESETPLEALNRELEEELGIDVNFFKEYSLIWSGNYKGMYNDKGIAHLFCLEQSSRNLREYVIGEGAGIAYFNISELKDLKMDKAIKDFLDRFIKWRNWGTIDGE